MRRLHSHVRFCSRHGCRYKRTDRPFFLSGAFQTGVQKLFCENVVNRLYLILRLVYNCRTFD